MNRRNLKRQRSYGVKKPSRKRSRNVNYVPRTGGFYAPATSKERKFKDTTVVHTLAIGAATWTAPAAGNLINGLVPGSAATERIGRKVTFRSLYIRGRLSFGAAVTNSCQVRMLVVLDKQANATLPATTDILLSDDYLAPNNISNKDRFVVLLDKVTPSVDAAQTRNMSVKYYKKFRHDTMFNTGIAGTIGDITTGAIYCIAAQSGGAGTAAPVFTCQCRLRYDDV